MLLVLLFQKKGEEREIFEFQRREERALCFAGALKAKVVCWLFVFQIQKRSLGVSFKKITRRHSPVEREAEAHTHKSVTCGGRPCGKEKNNERAVAGWPVPPPPQTGLSCRSGGARLKVWQTSLTRAFGFLILLAKIVFYGFISCLL